MTLLQQHKHIVGKRREGGETSTKTRYKQQIHRGRYYPTPLGQRKEYSDKKTSYHIYYKRSPRKYRYGYRLTQPTGEVSQRRTKKSSKAGNKHRFQHLFAILVSRLSSNFSATLWRGKQICGILFASKSA